MTSPIDRREALRLLAGTLSAGALLPLAALGCKRSSLDCTSTVGLSTEDVSMRTTTAAYVDHGTEFLKKCSTCVQWIEAAPNQCGGCKVIKGPINADGSCRLWVGRPL